MRERLLAASGLASAVAASSCCILPLALLGVGIGGVGTAVLAALAPFQPLFIGLAVVFLGAGFWLAYRPYPAGCQDGECRQRLGRGIIKGMILTKAALWGGAALLAVTLGLEAQYWGQFWGQFWGM